MNSITFLSFYIAATHCTSNSSLWKVKTPFIMSWPWMLPFGLNPANIPNNHVICDSLEQLINRLLSDWTDMPMQGKPLFDVDSFKSSYLAGCNYHRVLHDFSWQRTAEQFWNHCSPWQPCTVACMYFSLVCSFDTGHKTRALSAFSLELWEASTYGLSLCQSILFSLPLSLLR